MKRLMTDPRDVSYCKTYDETIDAMCSAIDLGFDLLYSKRRTTIKLGDQNKSLMTLFFSYGVWKHYMKDEHIDLFAQFYEEILHGFEQKITEKTDNYKIKEIDEANKEFGEVNSMCLLKNMGNYIVVGFPRDKAGPKDLDTTRFLKSILISKEESPRCFESMLGLTKYRPDLHGF